MTRRWGWTTALVMVAVTAVCLGAAAQKPAAAKPPQSAEQLMGVALHQEEVEGNLQAAIATYQQVVKAPGVPRALAARAQFRIGACYERLGVDGARKAYELVVSQYGDQSEFAAKAKARLGALGDGAFASPVSAVSTTRLLWKNTRWGEGARLSPDGRKVAFVDETRSLGLCDVATGVDRLLVAGSPDAQVAFEPTWSPDGGRIAFTWITDALSRRSTFELRVVDVKSGVVTAYEATRDLITVTHEWSADGTKILLEKPRMGGWVWLSLSNQAVASAANLPKEAEDPLVSPDGLHIAFFQRVAGTNGNGIFLAPSDGSVPTLLVGGQPRYAVVAWTADGKGLVATSPRSGRDGIWLLALAGLKLDGTPRLLREGFTGLQFGGLSRAGAMLYSTRTGLPQLTETEVDLAEGRRGAARALDGTPGADWVDYPSYSPDGRRIAYFAAFGDRRALVVKTLDEPKDRVYFVENLRPWYYLPPTWSADGRSVFVGTVGEATISRVDLASGGVEALVSMQSPRPTFDNFTAISPDGRSAYVERQTVDPRTYHVSRLDISSGTETEVHSSPHLIGAARLSPDGRWLAFDEYDGAAQALSYRTLPAGGGSPRLVCTLDQFPRHLEVSADSRWLVFQTMNVGKRGQVRDIWVAPLTGGEPRRLNIAGNMNSFSLHPDGKRIVFGNRTKPDEEVLLLENFLPPAKAATKSVGPGKK